MSDDAKKTHDKKNFKEQRKPRQRHQQNSDKKQDKKGKDEEPQNAPKGQNLAPQKPVYESPPPEFFKNLKRETDEILKITEEETSKYKKKEIQSNWSKYEMPIESYDKIDEQENMGADYEKLIQAPLSVGGHFQFKHEKSWDITTGPSLYDKYFDINMVDLNLALCTIPFYERNNIDKTDFSENDILTMNSRATRYKQKYFNDKSYSTPETEAHDKILSSFKDSVKTDNSKYSNANKDNQDDDSCLRNNNLHVKDIDLNFKDDKLHAPPDNVEVVNKTDINNDADTKECEEITDVEKKMEAYKIEDEFLSNTSDTLIQKSDNSKAELSKIIKPACITPELPKKTPAINDGEPKKNPVIESPEDLEKWLDDFLDG